MNARVCEARAKAWEAMPNNDKLRTIYPKPPTAPTDPDLPVALLIPCPPPSALPSGCGAAAGEPCREPAQYVTEAKGAPPGSWCFHCRFPLAQHEEGFPVLRYVEATGSPYYVCVAEGSAKEGPSERAQIEADAHRRQTAPILDVPALLAERDALRASDAAVRAALGARDGEETAEAGRRVSGERDAAREFARTCRDDFDCDDDAHRYGTFCRVCRASAVLREAAR